MLKITDSGVGLSPEEGENLFLDFENLDENCTESRHKLGLSICKFIIEQMGGSVRVESIVGEGTTFILHFKFKCIVCETDEESVGRKSQSM